MPAKAASGVLPQAGTATRNAARTTLANHETGEWEKTRLQLAKLPKDISMEAAVKGPFAEYVPLRMSVKASKAGLTRTLE